jgi:Zn-dependent protease with chaperone function
MRRALIDFQSGRLRALGPTFRFAQLLSLIVIIVPVTLVGIGVWFAISTLPDLGGFFFGGIAVAVGLFLLPSRFRLPDVALTRADAPRLFRDLDHISAAMGGPKFTHVVIDDSFSAYVVQNKKQLVLGIGAPFWEALTAQQRRAVVAHEIAHLVNGDPARKWIVAVALQMLEKWELLIESERSGAEQAVAAMLMWPLRWAVAVLNETIRTLLYVQSQRAEYLADALAAQVAGVDAVKQALFTSGLVDLIAKQLAEAHGVGTARGRDVIRWIVQPLNTIGASERTVYLQQYDSAIHAVDVAHPPTAFRANFLDQAKITMRKSSHPLLENEDAAFSAAFDRVGEQIGASLEVQ